VHDDAGQELGRVEGLGRIARLPGATVVASLRPIEQLPVSCAVGLAVLDVIEREGLQRHTLEVGNRMLDGLRELQERRPLIGDVRGLGLFIGVELVRDHETLEPADTEAERVIDEMKARGFLLSTDGPLHNVLKIKPPLVLKEDDVDEMLEALDEVLGGID
jgi:4-aminobutyrate aminotransferase-like enzyme